MSGYAAEGATQRRTRRVNRTVLASFSSMARIKSAWQATFHPRIELLEDRCLLSGGTTEFDLHPNSFILNSLAAGPDGSIWFTDSLGGSIGRITPDGRVTEYPVQDYFPALAVADGYTWCDSGRFSADGT